eukprot:92497_1
MSHEMKPPHEHKEEGPTNDKHSPPPPHHGAPHHPPHHGPPHHGPPHHGPHGHPPHHPPHHGPHHPPHHPPPPPHHERGSQILSHNHFHGSIWFVIIALVAILILALSIGLNFYLLFGPERNNGVCIVIGIFIGQE